MTELRIPSLISLMETALVVEWPAARGSSKLVTSHTEDVVPEVLNILAPWTSTVLEVW